MPWDLFPHLAAASASACTGIQPPQSGDADHYSGRTGPVYTTTAKVAREIALPEPLQAALTTTAPPAVVHRCSGFYHYSGLTTTGGDKMRVYLVNYSIIGTLKLFIQPSLPFEHSS